MSQISLLPIRLIDEQPADKALSKDLLWIGFDEQDRRYALKTVEPNCPHLPLIEWLCYHLCGLAGILTPDFGIVRRIDGSEAFGSRWAEGAHQFSPGKVSSAEFANWMSKAQADVVSMFALDAFMPNGDRHVGNILFQQTGSRLRALAFDWSRTHFFEPWPWKDDSNSAKLWCWLTHSDKIQAIKGIRARMERIKSITGEQVQEILEAAPAAWRDTFDCAAAGQWWNSQSSTRAQDAIRLLNTS